MGGVSQGGLEFPSQCLRLPGKGKQPTRSRLPSEDARPSVLSTWCGLSSALTLMRSNDRLSGAGQGSGYTVVRFLKYTCRHLKWEVKQKRPGDRSPHRTPSLQVLSGAWGQGTGGRKAPPPARQEAGRPGLAALRPGARRQLGLPLPRCGARGAAQHVGRGGVPCGEGLVPAPGTGCR